MADESVTSQSPCSPGAGTAISRTSRSTILRILAFAFIALPLAACAAVSTESPSLSHKPVAGRWESADGYWLELHADGTAAYELPIDGPETQECLRAVVDRATGEWNYSLERRSIYIVDRESGASFNIVEPGWTNTEWGTLLHYGCATDKTDFEYVVLDGVGAK